MRGEWLLTALCVMLVGGTGVGTTVLTTPDVSAKWLEGFRRDLLRETYDYGPAPDTWPRTWHGASGPQRAAPDHHEALTGGKGNNSADDAASRELGISRRDLYGPKDEASLTDVELEGPRRPFLESLHELEEQLKPVYVRPGAPTRQKDLHTDFKKSRKRNEDGSGENVEEETPYIVQGGIKRYKVHTDPKQRFRNQFGDTDPFLPEEWGIKTQESHGSSVPERENTQYRSEGNENKLRYESEGGEDRLPYNQRYEGETRPQYGNEDKIPYGEENESHDGQRYRAQDVQYAKVEQRYQNDRSGSSSDQDPGESVEQTEQDVSEYKRENVRSRYVEGLRRSGGSGGYAERFAARRDAALLADGLASRKPCDCRTEDAVVPEL